MFLVIQRTIEQCYRFFKITSKYFNLFRKNINCSCHRNAIYDPKILKRTYSLQHFHNQGTDISQLIEITFTYFDIEEGIVKIYTD